jgi:hypothetical protein
MILAVWLLSLPFRFLEALGLRRSVILACLLVLAVTAYGVAQDLGLIEPPAQAAPARKPAPGPPSPSQAAVADIPAQYLRLYRSASARYRVPWPVLAAIGKVESDHGRTRLPGVRSGSNWAGACGPMQIGCVPGSKAGNAWARYGHGRPPQPHQRHPGRRPLPGRPRRPPQPRPSPVRLQPLLVLRGPGQAAGPPLHRRGWAAVSGRIVLHLDRGLGWTKPLTVAGCGLCGAELARHPNPDRALRTAHRRRCPACGTRSARRLPGTTSLAADLALVQGRPQPFGRRRWPPAPHPARVPRAERR